MSERRIIDTNLIVRYLVEDNERHAKAAEKLFAACDRGELVIVLLPVVLAECLFVLDSFYQRPRADIATALGAMISSPGIEIADTAIYLDALRRYARTRLHFVDCVIASAASASSTPVATFDRGFRRFADVRVELD